ncbi:Ig-like domain-containing protein [Pseudomonas sp. HS6]|uniref:Ig-like domain-containing protein n=1 Tax=Pseudomonas sp. HS6 TaxID=2850559 RepID=UPI002019F7C4|nr:Ig-like domain-containing protein [Pseudomonas sp. HS6]UQS17578.1 hypothetical protein JJN09_12180 [Pseudomonas sp. HS6]
MNTNAVNVAIVDGKTITQTTELPNDGSGKPVRIKAIADGKYILAEGDKGVAPQNITIKRVGKDLHVALEGTDLNQPQLIIEGFFDAQGQLIGVGEDGAYYEYISSDAEQDHSAPFLIDGMSSPQVLGSEQMVGFGNGLVTGVGIGWFWPALLGLAGVGLLGAGYAASRDDDSHKDEVAAALPVTPNLGSSGDNVGDQTGPLVSGEATDDTTPTFNGVGTPGNTIIVYDGDEIIGEAIVGDDGAWTFTPDPALGGGAHEIIFVEEDPQGHQSAPSEGFEFIVDITAPGKSMIVDVLDNAGDQQDPVAQNGFTDDNTPTLRGRAEPGATVEIFANGVKIGEAPVDAAGNWSFSPTQALSDGTYEFSAVAVDAAGNRGLASDPYVLTIDATAPGKPGEGGNGGIDSVVDDVEPGAGQIANGGYTNDTTPTLGGGNQQPGDTVIISDNGVIIGSAVVDANGNWTFTPETPLIDGTHNLTIVVTDSAGNSSEASDPYWVNVKTEAPGKPGEGGNGGIDSVIDDVDSGLGQIANGGLTNDTTPTLSGGNQRPGDTVTISDNGTVIGSAIVDADGNWSLTPEAPLSDGTHSLTMVVSDPAGNVSEASDPYVVIVETVAPGKPGEDGNGGIDSVVDDVDTGIGQIANGGLTNDNTPTLSGGNQQPGDTVIISDNGTVIGSAVVDADGNWTFTPVTPLSEGSHELTIAVSDPAGNVSEASDPYRVIVESVAPGKPGEGGNGGIDSVVDDVDSGVGQIANGGLTNDTTPTLSGGNQQPGDTVIISDNGTVIGSAVVDADGNWSFTPDTALTDGSHNLTMTVSDPAGNVSEASDPYVVIVETVAPGKPGEDGNGGIDSVVDDVNTGIGQIANGGLTNDATPTLSGGNQQPGDTVIISDNGTVIGSAVVDASGNWTFTPDTALIDGTHNFTMTVSDPAGNVSEASDPYVVFLETVAPGKPGQDGNGGIDSVVDDVDSGVGQIANGGLTNDNTPTLSGGNQQPGDTVIISDNGNVIGSAVVDADGNWTFTPDTALTDGSHNLTMTVSDPAGNVSEASDPYVVIVETVAPGKPGEGGNGGIDSVVDDVDTGIGQIANGGLTNDNTPTLSGSNQQPGDTVIISDNGTVIGSAVVDADGNWTFTPEDALTDGTHNLTMAVSDPAGNMSEASEPYVVIVETVAPEVQTTVESMGKDGGSSSTDFITNDGTAGRLIEGSLTAALVAGEKVQVSTDEGATWGDALLNADGTWSYVDLTAHNGDWVIQTRVVDLAGNVNAISSQNVDLDTVAPSAPTSLEFNGAVVTVNFDGNGINPGDTVQLVVGEDRFEVQLTQAQIDDGKVDITTNASAAMTNSHAVLIDVAGNVSQQLMPVLETVDFESETTGEGIPAGGVKDFGAFTFNWGGWTTSNSPLGVIEGGLIDGFNAPSVGLSFVTTNTRANPSISLNGGVEAGSMSFLVGDASRPITLNFLSASGELVHTVMLPSVPTGVQEVNFQLPDGKTFTTVEFAGTDGDWTWVDNFKFSNGSFDHVDPPALQQIEGTGAYYGDDADNVFALNNTAHLNDASSIVNGGEGRDTLSLVGTNQVLNLDNIAGKLESIEIVDITGTGNNALTLSLNDVLALGQTSLFVDDDHVQLMINGNAGDVVNLNDQLSGNNTPGDWSAQGDVTVGGVIYNVYGHSAVDAELLVQQGVTTNLV